MPSRGSILNYMLTTTPTGTASDPRAKLGEASCDATARPMRAQPLYMTTCCIHDKLRNISKRPQNGGLGADCALYSGLRCNGMLLKQIAWSRVQHGACPCAFYCKGRDMLISVEGAPMQWFFIRLVSASSEHFPQPFAVDAFGGASPFPTDSPPDAHCLPGQACPVAFYR